MDLELFLATSCFVRHNVHSISDELTTIVEADGVAACSSPCNDDSEDIPLGSN